MTAVRRYLLGLVAAAIFCGILRKMLPEKSSAGKIINMMTGLLLALTVTAPLLSGSAESVERWLTSMDTEGANAAAQGSADAQEAWRQGIKERLAAYILNEADSLGASLQVEVYLQSEDPPVPERICLSGRISPYARGQLKQILCRDLGITEEQILWTG